MYGGALSLVRMAPFPDASQGGKRSWFLILLYQYLQTLSYLLYSMLACRGVGIEHWGTVGGIVLVQFAVKLFYSMATSVTPFGALLLNFSDVLRDPSFRAKAAVAGTMIICGGVYSFCSIIDSWRYYDLWLCKGHQIVLQVRPHAHLLSLPTQVSKQAKHVPECFGVCINVMCMQSM